ncbi:unnamed protein product [Polarella glacialis]|uniref:Pseudouridine synthase RsuA/RluA-like domain-containing protein n=1 Tax=Polarella glacialis TaxID=89957 RepID=A0A813GE75_POLGL|nr:unnamed protein product [Polarella glacialis]
MGYGPTRTYVLKKLLRAGRVFVDGTKEVQSSRKISQSAVFRAVRSPPVAPTVAVAVATARARAIATATATTTPTTATTAATTTTATEATTATTATEILQGQLGEQHLGRFVDVLGPTLLLYNKPCGRISALSDKDGVPHIDIPEPFKDAGLHHVGRLDQHSTGLLLLTNDGHLTRRLIDPRSQISREYVCVVSGEVDSERLRQQLEKGVETRFGTFCGVLLEARSPFHDEYEHQQCCRGGDTQPHRNDGPPLDDDAYELQNQQQQQRQQEQQEQQQEQQQQQDQSSNEQLQASGSRRSSSEFCDDDDDDDDCDNTQDALVTAGGAAIPLSEVRLQVMEGKKREVRRMLAYCGHVVLNLRRESFGPIRLGTLKMGEVREALPSEMSWAIGLL